MTGMKVKPMKVKLPVGLARAEVASRELEHELHDTIRMMEKWPEVRDAVLAWANGATATNCGWTEFGLASRIIERWRQVKA